MTEISVEKWPTDWPSAGLSDQHRLAAHDPNWLTALSNGLKHRSYLIKATQSGRDVGLLPLCLVKGPLFGRFLVSMPYLNTGGVWAADSSVASSLIDSACELADQLDVKYLELRHETPIEHPKLNFDRTDKVHMRLELPDDDDKLQKSFKSKVRSQIKKSGTYGHTIAWGSDDLLDEFYEVFAVNMRDLGTPVFSKSLFQNILAAFGQDAELCVVRNETQPIAASLLVHQRGVSEVPSASSLREFNRTGANMLMYRNLLTRAIERKSTLFDFGRSSEDSGTYKFKAQWGSKPHPAHWQYYVRQGDPSDMRPDAGGKKRLVETWQKLPVWLTKVIGPSIVRGIP